MSSVLLVMHLGMTQARQAGFFKGQIVYHKKFHYRGVIFGVDPTFQGSEEWYNAVAKSHPPKDAPWYHVLVDGALHTTYVAEQHLEPDRSGKPIAHPMVSTFFQGFENGHYQYLTN